jgi:UDPglucose--hexose-1-phosphate uridylyltransferase
MHEVVIETTQHHARLSELDPDHLRVLFDVYQKRVQSLSHSAGVRSVLLFRNDGANAGASQEHPHTQLLALPMVPPKLAREVGACENYIRSVGRCPTCDMLERETGEGTLHVVENEDFVALASFASRFPYETWIVPKEHGHDFATMCDSRTRNFATIVRAVLTAMEQTLGRFSFNMVLLTAPTTPSESVIRGFHWRLEIIPRLTIPSGCELGSDLFLISVAPEEAAAALRAASR